jgi:hypothetical protein
MRTVALFLLCTVLALIGCEDTSTSFTNGIARIATSRPASPSTFIPNKMAKADVLKLASRLTYGMPEKDAIRFLKQNGLVMDLGKDGDSFSWSDGFSFSNSALCLMIAPKNLQPNGDWVNGLLQEAFINENDGKRVSIVLKNAPEGV